MIPQATQLVNTEYFKNLAKSIESADSCAALQEIAGEAFASLSAVKSGIAAELEKYQPLLALLNVPSVNLAAIVTWIRDFITAYLTPAIKPAITYAAQLAELIGQVSSLAAALAAAEKRFTNCSISIPSI